MSQVVLFSYRMKLNISRRKGVTKILPKNLHCHFKRSLQYAIKKSLTKFRCIGTLSTSNQNQSSFLFYLNTMSLTYLALCSRLYSAWKRVAMKLYFPCLFSSVLVTVLRRRRVFNVPRNWRQVLRRISVMRRRMFSRNKWRILTIVGKMSPRKWTKLLKIGNLLYVLIHVNL